MEQTMNINLFLSAISLITAVSAIGGLIGAIATYRSTISKENRESQASTISAMHEEIDMLRERLIDLENENEHLNDVVDAICRALKVRGMEITIESNSIFMSDGRKSHRESLRKKSDD
jgi:cell division protein FtsB